MTEHNEQRGDRGLSWDHDDERLDVRRVVLTIAKQWRMVALATIFGAAVGFAVGASRPPVYESTARVDVGSPGPGQGEIVSMLRLLVDNQTVAAHVIKEGGLDRPPFNLTPPQLASVVSSRSGPGNVFLVGVRLGDPKLAEQAVGGIARRSSQLVRERRISVAQRTYKIERDGSLRRELDVVLASISSERARLRANQAEVASTPSKLTLKRTGSLPGQGDSEAAGASQTEVLNPSHYRLSEKLETNRAELAALEARRDHLMAATKGVPSRADLTTSGGAEFDAVERDPPQVVDPGPGQSGRVDRGPSYYVTAGFGIGLLLSCLGVLLFGTVVAGPVRS